MAAAGGRCFVDGGCSCGRVDDSGGCWRKVFVDDGGGCGGNVFVDDGGG